MKVKILRSVCAVAVAASLLCINASTKAEVKCVNTLAPQDANNTIEAVISGTTEMALVPEGPIVIIFPRSVDPTPELAVM